MCLNTSTRWTKPSPQAFLNANWTKSTVGVGGRSFKHSMTHLAVNRRRSEAKLLDKSHEGALLDPTQVFGRLWDHRVVALLGLLLRHHRAVIWRSCRERGGISPLVWLNRTAPVQTLSCWVITAVKTLTKPHNRFTAFCCNKHWCDPTWIWAESRPLFCFYMLASDPVIFWQTVMPSSKVALKVLLFPIHKNIPLFSLWSLFVSMFDHFFQSHESSSQAGFGSRCQTSLNTGCCSWMSSDVCGKRPFVSQN